MCTRKKCFEDIRFSENSDLSILFRHVAEWLETHDIEFNGRRLHGLFSRNWCPSRGSFSNLSQNLTPEAFVSLSIIHLASHRERPINTFANKKNAHSLSKWVVIHEVTSRSFTHTHTHKKALEMLAQSSTLLICAFPFDLKLLLSWSNLWAQVIKPKWVKQHRRNTHF